MERVRALHLCLSVRHKNKAEFTLKSESKNKVPVKVTCLFLSIRSPKPPSATQTNHKSSFSSESDGKSSTQFHTYLHNNAL